MRQRKRDGRFADQQLAVGAYGVGFRIDIDFGVAPLCTMSAFFSLRVPDTATSVLRSPSASTAGFFNADCETKVTEVLSACPKLPNIGR